MEHFKEEILEAIWAAEEKNEKSIEAVTKDFEDKEMCNENLEEMKVDNLIRLEGSDIYLTDSGREAARKVTRRHRLTECLMGYVLNLDPETMEKVACETEHSLLPEVESSICTLLGHPEIAPDGTIVPPGECCANGSRKIEKTIVSLSDCDIGDDVKVAYIRSGSHERLQQLSTFGIIPGVQVKIQQKTPACCLQIENSEIAIDKDIAADLFVWKM